MTIKYLRGAYPEGYNLSGAYTDVVITNSASIGGSGVVASFAATIQNFGQVVAGYRQNGISLSEGGTIINGSSSDTGALISSATERGIVAESGTSSIVNYGSIHGVFAGIDLYGKATIRNGSSEDTTATIYSEVAAIIQNGNYLTTLLNYGTVQVRSGDLFSGVALYGGEVINGSPVDLTASIAGINMGSQAAYITNFGTIFANSQYSQLTDGIDANGSGIITNGSSTIKTALIKGYDGVVLGGRATVDNFGTIAGTSYSVYFGSAAALLRIEPGSTLVGAIAGLSYGDTIDIAGKVATAAYCVNNMLTITNGTSTVQVLGVVDGYGKKIDYNETTFDVIPDGVGGSNVVTGPTDSVLAQMASDDYMNTDALFGTTVGEFSFGAPDNNANDNILNRNDFFADFYVDSADKQIVVSFRGTVLSDVTNLLADLSFGTGDPTQDFLADISESASYLASIEKQYAGYDFTLTGHSLGGAIAQILGQYTGLPAVGFDAPGGEALFNNVNVQAAMACLSPIDGVFFADTGANINICMAGDQISLVGTRIGSSYTVPSDLTGLGFDPNNAAECAIAVLASHSYLGLAQELAADAPLTSGQNYANALLLLAAATAVSPLSFWTGAVAYADVADLVVSGPGAICALDPGAANEYTLTAAKGSPNFQSLMLPFLSGISEFEVSERVNGKWSAATGVTPGGTYTFTTGATGLTFFGEDGNGDMIALPVTNDFFFGVSFDKAGTFNGKLTETLGTSSWGGGSGDWSSGANWSGGSVPGAGDDAVIKSKGRFTITISEPIDETLVTLQSKDGTVVDTAIVTLDSALELLAGTFDLVSGGVVSGGTLMATNGVFVWSGGTLEDVSYQGSLNLTAANANLSIDEQLIVTNSTGSSPGTINVTGRGSELSFIGEEVLNNATIALGSAAKSSPATIYSADPSGLGASLSLGGDLLIQQAGAFAVIGGSAAVATDGVTNYGTIDAGVSGGTFTIDPLNFTNVGTISVSNGDDLLLQPGTLTNLGGYTLTGGTLDVGQGSTIKMGPNDVVATDNATIILNGGGSTIESLSTKTHDEVLIDSTLAAINAAGTLELLGGRSWTSALSLTNAGSLDLGGGTFTTAGLINNGVVSGFGVVAHSVTNAGTIEANGGSLDLAASVSGAGALIVAAGATFEVDGSVASTQSLAFEGSNAVLALTAPSTFAATISGLALTGTIDLLDRQATSATLSGGDKLVIMDNGKLVAKLQLSGPYLGDTFTTVSDGHGGTDVTISAGGQWLPGNQRFVEAMAGFASQAFGVGAWNNGVARTCMSPFGGLMAPRSENP